MKRLTPGGASHRFANEMGYPACQCISRGQVCQTASQAKRLSQWLGRLADSTRPAGSEDVSFHQKFGAIRGQVRNIDRQSRGDCARSRKSKVKGTCGMRISDCGMGERAANHESRITSHEKAQWPNEPISAQRDGEHDVNSGFATT